MYVFEVSSAGREENGHNVTLPVLPAADVGWYIGNNGRVGTGHMHLCVYGLQNCGMEIGSCSLKWVLSWCSVTDNIGVYILTMYYGVHTLLHNG